MDGCPRWEDVQVGMLVKAKCRPASDGRLVAVSLLLDAPDEVGSILARIQHLDAPTRTLHLLGREIRLPIEAAIQDLSRNRAAFEALSLGEPVRCKGAYSQAAGFVPDVVKVQLDTKFDFPELKGRIDALDAKANTIRLLGFTVGLSPETRIKEAAGRDADGQETGAGARTVAVEANDPSEYMRPSLEDGARMREFRGRAGAIAGWADATDGALRLIDTVNASLMPVLLASAPRPCWVIAFVRGSAVRSRLHLARTFWSRIASCFETDRLQEELGAVYGHSSVDALFADVKRRTLGLALEVAARLGPAKLLFRLMPTDGTLLSRATYPEISRFIGDVARLADGSDEWIRGALHEVVLGRAEPPVARRLEALVSRFRTLCGLDSLDGPALDRLVALQRRANALHPALPIGQRAIEDVASTFGLSRDQGVALLTLFRFAWLWTAETADGVSDFSIKTLVLLPHGPFSSEDAGGAALRRLQMETQQAVDGHPGLRSFHARYPHVRIQAGTTVVILPREVFGILNELDDPERCLDLLVRYRMGRDYLQTALRRLGALVPSGRDAVGRTLTAGDIVVLTAKQGKNSVKRQQIASLALSPSRTRQLLEHALKEPGGDHAEQAARLFNDFGKSDLVGNIRGLCARA